MASDPNVNFVGTGMVDDGPPKVVKKGAGLVDPDSLKGNGKEVAQWGDAAAASWEGFDASDLGRPGILRILQSNSPEVDETEGKHLEGAKAGMIFNSGTRDFYDGKVGGIFIPVAREHHYGIWHPRDSGGGIVGKLPVIDPHILELRRRHGAFGKLPLPGGIQVGNNLTTEGDEAVETYMFYSFFMLDGQDALPVAVAFTSTQIKKYNVLMQKLLGLCGQPPRFPIWAWKWRLGTQPESNKKGKFHGWRIVLEGGSAAAALMSPKDPLVEKAADFFKLFRAGEVQADWGQTSGAADSDGEEPPF